MRFRCVCLLVPALIAPSPVAAEVEADAVRAAEKVELLGGRVLRDEAASGRPVVRVDFGRAPRFTDKYLHLLQAFPKLAEARLNGTAVTDAGIDELRHCRSLRIVDLWDTALTPAAIRRLMESMPMLRVVSETTAIAEIKRLGGRVDEVGAPLAGLAVAINLDGARGFGDDSLPYLRAFPKLTQLNLRLTGITNAGLKELGQMHGLWEIRLGSTQITDEGLAELKDLQGLTHLSLYGTQITDAGLKHLRPLQSVTELTLGEVRITDAGLKEVAKLKNLVSLYLSWTDITDAGLKSLAGLDHLVKLNVRGTQITDGALEELDALQGQLPSLDDLNLRETRITDRCVKHLTALRQLRRLNLIDTEITDAGLMELAKLKRLTELYVDPTKITDEGLKSLKAALPNTSVLTTPPDNANPRWRRAP